MNRTIRIVFIAAAALVLVVVLGVAVVFISIDPNDFKPQIETMVLEATGKPLSLEGQLSLSIFPNLAITAGPAELRDDDAFGPDPFARVETLNASVALIPLFRGKAEVDSMTVSGLRLKLAVGKDGKTNWTMPGKTDGKTGEFVPGGSENTLVKSSFPDLAGLTLDSLAVHDAAVVYTDMRSGQSTLLSIPKLAIDSFRVGQKTALSLEAVYADALPEPIKLNLQTEFVIPHVFDQGMSFNAVGKLDMIPFSLKGTIALPQTSQTQLISLKGEIAVGDITLDKYIPVKHTGKAVPSPGKQTERAQITENDETVRQFLNKFILDLYLSVKSLTVATVSATDIKAGIKADQGVLTVKPITMTLAEGPVTVETSLDARGEDIRSRLTGDWKQAKIGGLLRAATGKTSATGELDASWSLNATGTVWDTAVKTLSGIFTANLANGSVPAFRLIPPGISNLPAKTMDLNNVRVSGTWNVSKGIASNNDLKVLAAGLSASGTGQIDIPAQTLHYNITVDIPTLPELPSLTVLPVVISGPLTSLSYGIDQPKFLRDAAKSLADPATKTGRQLDKIGDKLERLLSR